MASTGTDFPEIEFQLGELSVQDYCTVDVGEERVLQRPAQPTWAPTAVSPFHDVTEKALHEKQAEQGHEVSPNGQRKLPSKLAPLAAPRYLEGSPSHDASQNASVLRREEQALKQRLAAMFRRLDDVNAVPETMFLEGKRRKGETAVDVALRLSENFKRGQRMKEHSGFAADPAPPPIVVTDRMRKRHLKAAATGGKSKTN